jgi:type II secretion system protein H
VNECAWEQFGVMCESDSATIRAILQPKGCGPRRRDAGAPREGFTLIELMVVMVLIGILSAMIIPEMKGTYGDALLRGSARELVNVFSIAYSRAVSLNEVHVVRIERSSGRYEIERQVRAQGKQTELLPLKDVSGSSGDLDSRITIEVHRLSDADSDNTDREASALPGNESQGEARSRPDEVTFYPDGTADAAEIVLRDNAGFGLRLKIDPITARVEILDIDLKTTDERR